MGRLERPQMGHPLVGRDCDDLGIALERSDPRRADSNVAVAAGEIPSHS